MLRGWASRDEEFNSGSTFKSAGASLEPTYAWALHLRYRNWFISRFKKLSRDSNVQSNVHGSIGQKTQRDKL